MSDTNLAPPPAPPAPPVPPAPPTDVWHKGVDAELIGHAQNKGWKLDDPKGAFEFAAKAARSAEQMLGVPRDQLLRIPAASASGADLDAFWQRIGAPKEAKDIDWSTVKTAAGEPIEPKLAERLTATAIASRAPKDVVLAIARDVVKHIDEKASTEKTLMAGQIAEQKAWLDQNWPAATRSQNEFIASQALAKIGAASGLTPEQTKTAWDAISKVGGIGAGYAAEMLRTIGVRMGEGKFVSLGGGVGGDMPMTVESAKDEIAMLKKDDAWIKKLHAGGKDENARWRMLHKISAGSQAA